MSDVNEFLNQVPKGWGLVPVSPDAQPEPEPQPPDHRTLVGRFPSTQTRRGRATPGGTPASRSTPRSRATRPR